MWLGEYAWIAWTLKTDFPHLPYVINCCVCVSATLVLNEISHVVDPWKFVQTMSCVWVSLVRIHFSAIVRDPSVKSFRRVMMIFYSTLLFCINIWLKADLTGNIIHFNIFLSSNCARNSYLNISLFSMLLTSKVKAISITFLPVWDKQININTF